MKSQCDIVLVVDDQEGVRAVVRTILTRYGFLVEEATSMEEAMAFVQTVKFDAVILSAELRGSRGVEVCRKIRQLLTRLPIVMLSVNPAEDQKVTALESGADDYVIRPCRLRELVARIRSAVRRGQLTPPESAGLSAGELHIDRAGYLVQKRGRRIHITPKEFVLLEMLMLRPDVTVTHSELLSSIRGPGFDNGVEYLRTFVRNLRVKIEDDPSNPRYIVTDPQCGYRFSTSSINECSPALLPVFTAPKRMIDALASSASWAQIRMAHRSCAEERER